MPAARKPIGKRLRFSVFERDGFTCQYCGKTPPDVILHVDHIIPVCDGGSNEEENLTTSCSSCNLGKGRRRLKQGCPDSFMTPRRIQEMMEAVESAKLLAKTLLARDEMRDRITKHLCWLLNREDCKRSSVTIIVNAIEEFGADSVIGWVDYAAAKTLNGNYRSGPGKEDDFIRYLSGILRNNRG